MPTIEEFADRSNPEVSVQGFLHRPTTSNVNGLVLTHGAGANCQTLLLTSFAEAFCAEGLTVLRCDLPFRQTRPHGPPARGSAERDQKGLQAAVASMRALAKGEVFLGGHSYGGRQASLVSADKPGLVERLLLLSFPLHPPKRPEVLRSAHFPSLRTPALFVHGARDGFGTPEEMDVALGLIPVPTRLILVAGAGHELMTNLNREVLIAQIVPAFLSFAN